MKTKITSYYITYFTQIVYNDEVCVIKETSKTMLISTEDFTYILYLLNNDLSSTQISKYHFRKRLYTTGEKIITNILFTPIYETTKNSKNRC